MGLRTKTGEMVTDIRIDRACYYMSQLVQVWGVVGGQSRLLYISDLREDNKHEIDDVIGAALKGR